MTAGLDELVGRVLGGRYRLVRPIATGSSARVFLADDITLRRRVAVKVLHATLAEDEVFAKRFRAEAQAVAALSHPHVLSVFDWGRDEVTYLVSEYLGGGTLRAMLDAGHRLSPSQALLVGLEAARGLEYAHKRGLVHRDIKPANLLFDDEGRLRIGDFGLARAMAEAAWTEPAGVMLGTMRYASPEQAKGESLTVKSDIYSLALVLVEAVSGDVPFTADTALGTLMARIDQPLHAPAELGPLAAAVERAAHPNADDRPDASEFAIALMAAAEELVRPEPLPLVGAIPRGAPLDADRDPTLIAPSEIYRPERVVEPVDRMTNGSSVPAVRSATPIARQRRPVNPSVPPDDDYKPRRRAVALGLFLVAAIIAASVAALNLRGERAAAVPAFVDQVEADVQAQAEKHGWVLDRQIVTDDVIAKGRVVETQPGAGSKLKRGETLRYFVSIGLPLIDLPPGLVGKAAAEARELLTQAGFTVGEPKVEFDEKAARNTVVRILDPAGKEVGQRAEKASTLALIVSGGPQPRTVPAGLEGRPRDEVVNALRGARLVPQVKDDFHETVPAGAVIRVEPGAGTSLEADAAVSVTVSKGPAPRPVPNVVGMTVTAASEALTKAGFEVAGVTGPLNTAVIATDPPANEVRPFKDKVQIITRRT